MKKNWSIIALSYYLRHNIVPLYYAIQSKFIEKPSIWEAGAKVGKLYPELVLLGAKLAS